MNKKTIFIIGIVILSFGLGVIADTLYQSNQIMYKNSTTVKSALDDLYSKVSYGDATASDIKEGKTALVNGERITGVGNGALFELKADSILWHAPTNTYVRHTGNCNTGLNGHTDIVDLSGIDSNYQLQLTAKASGGKCSNDGSTGYQSVKVYVYSSSDCSTEDPTNDKLLATLTTNGVNNFDPSLYSSNDLKCAYFASDMSAYTKGCGSDRYSTCSASVSDVTLISK